jgi:hypothetical protein
MTTDMSDDSTASHPCLCRKGECDRTCFEGFLFLSRNTVALLNDYSNFMRALRLEIARSSNAHQYIAKLYDILNRTFSGGHGIDA